MELRSLVDAHKIRRPKEDRSILQNLGKCRSHEASKLGPPFRCTGVFSVITGLLITWALRALRQVLCWLAPHLVSPHHLSRHALCILLRARTCLRFPGLILRKIGSLLRLKPANHPPHQHHSLEHCEIVWAIVSFIPEFFLTWRQALY